MARSLQSWSIPGVILFSHGGLSYEVDLLRPLAEELAKSKLGEQCVPAWERTERMRLREVIVRTLPAASPEDVELVRMRARLREEAWLATYLRHPNIAETCGPYEIQGVLYVVSERVEGASLHKLINHSMRREVPYSPALCLYVGAEVASALHHAHTRTHETGAPLGILHRDVNPARIFFGPEGGVVLTDFARARSLLPGRVASTLPHPKGDVFYCAPEALLGEELDPRSDLFSLGLVLLELATWHHLYHLDYRRPSELEAALTPEAKAQVLGAALIAAEADLPDYAEDCILQAATFTRQDVEKLTRQLTEPLRSILRQLLQRRPEDRYPTAAALEAELRAGLEVLERCYGEHEALEEVLQPLERTERATV